MKSALNTLLLALLVAAHGTALFFFGGILPEYAQPLYLILAGLIGIWGIKWLLCRHVSWVWSPLHVPILLFFGYALWRYFASPIEHDSRQEILHLALWTMVYLLVANNLYQPRDRLVLTWTIIILAVAESAYAIWQLQTGHDQALWLDRSLDYPRRGGGTFYCPNHLAGFLEVGLALLLAWLLVDRQPLCTLQSLVLRRLGEIVALGLILVGLFSTKSRGGWIATGVAGLAVLLIAERVRAVSSRVAITGFAIFALALGIAGGTPAIRERIQQSIRVDVQYRLGETPVEIAEGFGGRVPMWRGALKIIRDHPIFGTGPATWQWYQLKYRPAGSQVRPQYTHNDYLQLLAEYGLIGGLIILGVLVCFFWQAFQLARHAEAVEQRALAIGAITATVALGIHSFVDFNLHLPANHLLFATLFGLIAAQGRGARRDWRTETRTIGRIVFGTVLIFIGLLIAYVSLPLTKAARILPRAYDAAQQHEWDAALRLYGEALAHDPRNPATHAQIGDIFRTQSALTTDPELQSERRQIANQAITAYRRALELNRFHSEVILKMAAAYELAGNPTDAFRWYEQALQVDPNNTFIWIRLGTFYHRQGDTPKAITALQRAHQLSPGDWTAPNLLKEIQAPPP